MTPQVQVTVGVGKAAEPHLGESRFGEGLAQLRGGIEIRLPPTLDEGLHQAIATADEEVEGSSLSEP